MLGYLKRETVPLSVVPPKADTACDSQIQMQADFATIATALCGTYCCDRMQRCMMHSAVTLLCVNNAC
jgi:hypothetical protein